MQLAATIAHLLIPRESNNHRAKLLHLDSLTLLVFGLIFYQLALEMLPTLGLRVLGYKANIPPTEVIRLTNEKRAANGLPLLVENPTLSKAALAKGEDMLSHDYWAHVAPDGTQPWKFFGDFGYKYRYAGENLARDFSNPSDAVNAWMTSSSHRENLLSAKYKEIGIAVVEGDLAGVETTIIVQFFGTKYTDTVPIVPVAQVQPQTIASPTPQVLISPFQATKSISLILIGVLLSILLIDIVVISKRRIARIGGRTLAHLSFLGMILVVLILAKAGQIL